MFDKKLSSTDQIEARCTKCRQNTNHIIVAMLDDKPVKVQCNSCLRQHKYRPPTGTNKAETRNVSGYRTADQKKWELRCANSSGEVVKNYSMDVAYKTDTLVNHPAFGCGVVQQMAGVRKVEILFESGTKLMRCK